ncbi:MAG TPA: methyltransferase domain-containing protein [Burkholderiaceae bacterium]|nr:methyltransferase domain-containing protein [Burkholderiaceae bacterium]
MASELEVYTQQANPAFEAALATRTAARDAAFFSRHLRQGMRVLDVGCGPGTITVGVAQLVAPGVVIGIDIQPSLVERARALAAARALPNVRFEVADVHALPFADGSFDAAFGNGVLMHLAEPMHALTQMRRVLRPGGVIGVRDPDFGSVLHAPLTPALQHWLELRVRVRRHNGGDPFLGRQLRRLLLEAGFVDVAAGASVDSAGAPDELQRHAAFLQAQWVGLARTAVAQAWMDLTQVDATHCEIDAWAQRPDAFAATTWCEAVGTVPADPRRAN